MRNEEWNVNAKDLNCIEVDINQDIDIESNKLTLTIFNENRSEVVSMKVASHHISLCIYSGRPMFARLGDSVKYIDGSGADAYLRAPYTT